MPAYYRQTLPGFLLDAEDQVLGQLTRRGAEAGFFSQVHRQTAAWGEQFRILKAMAAGLLATEGGGGEGEGWELLLEYPIPRRGKRLDVVLIADSVLFVVEFKCGARRFDRADIALGATGGVLPTSGFHSVGRRWD